MEYAGRGQVQGGLAASVCGLGKDVADGRVHSGKSGKGFQR